MHGDIKFAGKQVDKLQAQTNQKIYDFKYMRLLINKLTNYKQIRKYAISITCVC